MQGKYLQTDYCSYYPVIVHLSRQIGPNVAIIVDSSCAADDIIALTSQLTLVRETLCYQTQLEEYVRNDIIRFLLVNDMHLVILLIPWYISIDLLQRVGQYQLDHVTFVTIDIRPAIIQHLESDYMFLKVINLILVQSTAMTVANLDSYVTTTQ